MCAARATLGASGSVPLWTPTTLPRGVWVTSSQRGLSSSMSRPIIGSSKPLGLPTSSRLNKRSLTSSVISGYSGACRRKGFWSDLYDVLAGLAPLVLGVHFLQHLQEALHLLVQNDLLELHVLLDAAHYEAPPLGGATSRVHGVDLHGEAGWPGLAARHLHDEHAWARGLDLVPVLALLQELP